MGSCAVSLPTPPTLPVGVKIDNDGVAEQRDEKRAHRLRQKYAKRAPTDREEQALRK